MSTGQVVPKCSMNGKLPKIDYARALLWSHELFMERSSEDSVESTFQHIGGGENRTVFRREDLVFKVATSQQNNREWDAFQRVQDLAMPPGWSVPEMLHFIWGVDERTSTEWSNIVMPFVHGTHPPEESLSFQLKASASELLQVHDIYEDNMIRSNDGVLHFIDLDAPKFLIREADGDIVDRTGLTAHRPVASLRELIDRQHPDYHAEGIF